MKCQVQEPHPGMCGLSGGWSKTAVVPSLPPASRRRSPGGCVAVGLGWAEAEEEEEETGGRPLPASIREKGGEGGGGGVGGGAQPTHPH